MKILILGANGFIGSHLVKAILHYTPWQVYAMDKAQDKITNYRSLDRMQFFLGDILKEKDWISEHIQQCDVVLPLVAIATPAAYVQNPLQVFELDFEANLDIVRQCVKFGKRIIFPSTSEVYGMCTDAEFDEENSYLVTGPIHKERWIYSSSKQLMDRLIYAYGKHQNLNYTLFRPFNWYGPQLDDVFNPKPGASRVLTQFIGNILRGEDIHLVNGGEQKRCFTYIDDGISALIKIIENKNNCAYKKIFNLGNPKENVSIRQLAEILLGLLSEFPQLTLGTHKTKIVSVSAENYYGIGYQDIELRVPAIQRAKDLLDWKPVINLVSGLRKTLQLYSSDVVSAKV